MVRPSPSRVLKNIERGRQTRAKPLTGTVRLAFSCPVAWEEMREIDAHTRRCDRCDSDVHDFSHLSSAALQTRVREAEGELCGQVRVRADGTVVDGACVEERAMLRGRLLPDPER